MKARRAILLAAFSVPFASAAFGAGFDVATEYRLRALSYKNLNLNPDNTNDKSFLSERARLGFTIKSIELGEAGGETQTMDVSIRFQALGVAGSSTPLTTPVASPFDRIAEHYPNTSFSPFLDNAFIRARNLGGFPWETVFGLQSFTLVSGLLLDDDGTGLTGFSAKGPLPWLSMSGQVFAFQARNSQASPNALNLYGLTIELPSEGTWQLNELIERDHATQLAPVTGCTGPTSGPDGECLVSQATRVFSSLRYTLNFGPLVFDGEAAIERGAATPTGPDAAQNHITYNANAEVLRAKWKQPLWGGSPGIARVTLARGSGDKSDTLTTDEAFFPSQGHRYDGLERSGFGEFFAATPYDAFGGQSTATASGLQRGASGILVVGIGLTPPAYKGIVLDVDYFLFQADRNVGPNRTLGRETDIRLRYDILDRFSIKASAALFSVGLASNPDNQSSARRYLLEASARF